MLNALPGSISAACKREIVGLAARAAVPLDRLVLRVEAIETFVVEEALGQVVVGAHRRISFAEYRSIVASGRSTTMHFAFMQAFLSPRGSSDLGSK